MKPLPRLSSLLVLLLTLGLPLAPAQDAMLPPGPLVIAEGKVKHDGRSEPATLANIVGLLRALHPRTNINIVGNQDLLVGDLVLKWGTAPTMDQLRGTLAAIAAASEGKIEVRDFGERDFLLRTTPNSGDSTAVEVFNLDPLLSRGVPVVALEHRLREAELQFAIADKTWPAGDKEAGLKQIGGETSVLRAKIADAQKAAESAAPVVRRIQEVVEMTLALRKLNEKSPQFSYHPGANLLIVTGSQNAIEVTRKVLGAMREGR